MNKTGMRESRMRVLIPLAGEPSGDHGLSSNALQELTEALSYLGVRVTRMHPGESLEAGEEGAVSSVGPAGALVIDYPDPVSANRMGTRHAGKRRTRVSPPPGSPFTAETGIREVLGWAEEHGYRQAMVALGVESVATYYRRMQLMRDIAAENDARRESGGDLLDERVGYLPTRAEAFGPTADQNAGY